MNPQWPYPQYPVPPPYSSHPLQQTPWNIQDANLAPPTVNTNVLPSSPAFTPVSFPFHVPPPNIVSTNVPPPTFCPNFAPPNYPVSASSSSQLTEPSSSSVKSPPPLPSESPPPLPSEPPPPLPSASPPPLPIDSPCHLPSDSSVFPMQAASASLVSSDLLLDDSSPSIVPESPYVLTQIPVLTESPTSSVDSNALLSNGLSSVLSNDSLQSAAVDVLPAMSTVSLPVESTEFLLPVVTKPSTLTLIESSTLPVESLSTMSSRLLSEKDDFVPVESSVAPVVSSTCLSTDSSPVSIQSTVSSVLNSPVYTASNSLIVSEAVSSSSSVVPDSTLPFAQIEKLPPMSTKSSHVESAGLSSPMPTVSLTTESSAVSIVSMSSRVLPTCDKSSVSIASSISPIMSATCVSTDSSLHLIQPTFSSALNSSVCAIASLCMASESISSVATDNNSSSAPTELLLSKSSISSPVESTQFSFTVPAESLNPIQIESIPTMPSRICEQILKPPVVTESSVAPVVATTCISANSSPVLNQPRLSSVLESSASAVSDQSMVSESSTSVSSVASNNILFSAPTEILLPKFISPPIKSAKVSFTLPTESIPALTEPLKDQSLTLPSSLAELSVAPVSATYISNDSSSLLHQPKLTSGLNSSGFAVSSPSVVSKFVSSPSSVVPNSSTSTPITEKLPSMSTVSSMVELAQFSLTVSTESLTPTLTESSLPIQPLPDMAARHQQDESSVPIESSIAPVVSSTCVSAGSSPVLIHSALSTIFRSSASAASSSIPASKSVSPGQKQIPSICYVLVPVKFSPQPVSPVQSNLHSIHIRPNHTFTFQTSKGETSVFNSPHVTSPISNIHIEPNHTHMVQTSKGETSTFNFSHVTSPDSKQGTTSIDNKPEQFVSAPPSSSMCIKSEESAFIHFAEAMVSQPLLPVNTATSSDESLQDICPSKDQDMSFLQRQVMQEHNYCSTADMNESNFENSCLWTKDNSEQNTQQPLPTINRQLLATVIAKDHDYCLPSNEPKHQFVLKKEISKKSNQVVSKKHTLSENETQQSKLSKTPSQMQLDSSFAKELSHNILPSNHKGSDHSNNEIYNSDFKKDENNLCHKIVESKENDDSGLGIKYEEKKGDSGLEIKYEEKNGDSDLKTKHEENIDDSNQEIKHMKSQSETSLCNTSSNDIIGNNRKLCKSIGLTDQQNHDDFYKKPLNSNFSEDKTDRFDSMAELNKTTDSDSKLENAKKNIFPKLSSFNVCNTSRYDLCNEQIQKLSSTNQENLNNKTTEHLNNAEKPDDKVEDTDAKFLTKVSDSHENIYFKSEIFIEESSCTNNSSNEHIQKLSSTKPENLNNKTIEHLNNAEKSDDKVEDTDAKFLTKVSDSHENIYFKSEIFIEESSCTNNSSNEHIQMLSSTKPENLNNKTIEHLNNAEKSDDKVEDTDAKFLTKVSDSHENIYFKSEISLEENSCTSNSSYNDSCKEGICTGDASDVTISDLFKNRDTSDSNKDTVPKADSHKDHCINISSANGEILLSDLKDSDPGNNQNSPVQKYNTGKIKTENSDIELDMKCDDLSVISNSDENLNSKDNSNKESNENLISGVENNYNDSQHEIKISDYSNKESSVNGLSVIKNVYEDSQHEIKHIDFSNKEPTENGLSVIKNIYDDSQHEIKKIDYSNKEPSENALSVIKNDYDDSQHETEDSDDNNKESNENLIKNGDSQREIKTPDYEEQKFNHNTEIEKTVKDKFVISENDSHETSDPCHNQNNSDQSNETVEFLEFDSYDSKLRDSHREFDSIWERSNSIENLNNSTENLSRKQHSHFSDDKRKKERKHRKRKHIHSVGNHETREHSHLIETHRKKEHSHSTESCRMKEIGSSHIGHRRREHSHLSRSRKKSEHHHSVKSPRKSKKSSPHLHKSPRRQLSGTKEHSSHFKKTMDEQDDRLLQSTKSYHSSRSPESIRNYNSQSTLSPESIKNYNIYNFGSSESKKNYNIYHIRSPESIKNYNAYYNRSPESIKNCSYRTISPESNHQHSRSPESLKSNFIYKSRSPKSVKKLHDRYYNKSPKVSERLADNIKDYNKFVDSNEEKFKIINDSCKESLEIININDSCKESHPVEFKRKRGRHRSRRKRNILTGLLEEQKKGDERSVNSEKGFNNKPIDSNKERLQSVSGDSMPRSKERLQSISRDNICRSKERLQSISRDNICTSKERLQSISRDYISISNERLHSVSRDDMPRNKEKLQNANRENISRSKERLQSISRDGISRKKRLQSISRDDISRKETLPSINKDDISRKERLQTISRDDIFRKERLQSISKDDISKKERLQTISRDDISRKERLQSVSRDISRKERLQSVSRDDISRKERLQSVSRDDISRKERLQHISRDGIDRKERSQSVSGDGIARKERLQSIGRDDISRKERLQSVSRDETFRSKERLRSVSRDDISRYKERLPSVNRDDISRSNGRLQSVNRDNIPRNKKRLQSISRDDLSRNKDRHHDDNLKMRRRRRSSTPKDLPCLSLKAYKYVSSTPADDYYYSKEKDSKEVIAKDALKALHEKFRYELVERAERVRASKPKYDPPKRKTKLRKPKPPKTDSNSDSSSSSEKSSSEEEDTSMEELERKKKHPYRLHLELWFNDPKEMNDGPLCRCSAKARRAGIRHGIYVGEDHLPLCNPLSNNVDRLYHYRITMTPHTNFLTKNPTTIHHNGQSYRFEGFSMFSHSKLPPLPNCKVIRFNYEYTIVYAEEEFPKNFTVEGLELFSSYLLVEILELVDLNWKAHDDPEGCPRFHFMPRFTRELRDGGKELLSHCYVLDYLLKQNQILVDEKKLSKILALNNLDWQDLADEVKGMIITCPGMKPSSIRVDQLDREQCVPDKEEFPVIVHFGVRPPQLSYAGNPHYQKAWRDYVKYRHLLANKPKVRYADRHRLLQKEVRLQEMRMENDLKRDVTVVISSKDFYKTGIMSDIVQHAMLLPVLVCHLRFHQSLTHLENKLGYKFQDRFLLQLALTHPSYRENFGTNPDHARNSLTNCGLRQPQYGDRRIHYMNTRKRGINTLINIMSRFGSRTETLSRINHNERLEFLGDAVVEFLSSIHLFYMFPDLEEGGLATYRAAIVQNQHLAVLSKKLELDRFMLYAHGSDLCHDLELRHAMANCFEALMGALFLDNGIEIADKVFSKTLFLEQELLEVWMNFSPHPLQEQEPHGDRKWIKSVPLLQKLHKFEETIGIEFNHIRLLARALTHRSLGYNNLTLGSNQRLEFLGDTVLQLVASEYLYKFFPEHHEGHLSLLRSSLVNNRTQAVVCADLGMVDYAIYPYDKVELKPKDKADLLEAFLGALYVDKDLGYCRKFCEVCFFPRLQDFIMNQDWNDPKSKLQQCCLTLRSMDGGEPDIPTYKVIECKGPTNTRVYSVAVYFQGNRLAVGSGHSIQQAEMDAALNALNMSKDLFPQLRHQRRAIERSLKKRPLNKNKFSLKKDKEKIFDKSKHLPKKDKEKTPSKSKHSPKKEKEKFFGKFKHSMPKKYKERLLGKIKYSPKKDKDKISDKSKHSPKKRKEKIFEKSKNLPKKYKIKNSDKSKHLSAKDENTSDKHKPLPTKEEKISNKNKHLPTKEEEKTSDNGKHLPTKEVEKTSDKSKHSPTKEVEKTSDRSKHSPTKEEEMTSDNGKQLPTKEVERTSDRSKYLPTKEVEKTSVKSKHSPIKDKEKICDKIKHLPKKDEEKTSEQAFTEENS